MGCIVYNKTYNLCYLEKINMTVPGMGFLYIPYDFDTQRDVFEPHVKLKHIIKQPFPKSITKRLVPAAKIEIDKAYAAGEFRYAEDPPLEEPEPEPTPPEPAPEPEPTPEEPPAEDSGKSTETGEGETSTFSTTTQSAKSSTKKKK